MLKIMVGKKKGKTNEFGGMKLGANPMNDLSLV